MQEQRNENKNIEFLKFTLIENFIYGVKKNSGEVVEKIKGIVKMTYIMMQNLFNELREIKHNLTLNWYYLTHRRTEPEKVNMEIEMVNLACYCHEIDHDNSGSVSEGHLLLNEELNISKVDNQSTFLKWTMSILGQLNEILFAFIVKPLTLSFVALKEKVTGPIKSGMAQFDSE